MSAASGSPAAVGPRVAVQPITEGYGDLRNSLAPIILAGCRRTRTLEGEQAIGSLILIASFIHQPEPISSALLPFRSRQALPQNARQVTPSTPLSNGLRFLPLSSARNPPVSWPSRRSHTTHHSYGSPSAGLGSCEQTLVASFLSCSGPLLTGTRSFIAAQRRCLRRL